MAAFTTHPIRKQIRSPSSSPRGGSATLGDRERGPPNLLVRDSAARIPEQHRGKTFERFYRVNAGRARSDGGAGLGLALVREIARLHGGNVSVESTVGRGSCFTLTLPAPGPDNRLPV